MTNDQINAAIAEVCGWTEIGICDCGFKIGGMPPYRSAHKKHIPDYCTDLNEMHDAEKVLGEKRIRTYAFLLAQVLDTSPTVDLDNQFLNIHATARQRAEAFLRTIGKWEEVQP